MDKPKIVIIEGCPSSGKTTVSNELREKLSNMTLMSLTGCKNKTIIGQEDSFVYHNNLLDYLLLTRNTKMDYVLCRSFISEKIYCNLGFKPYSFKSQYNILLNNLDSLSWYYDVYVILLTINQDQIKERIEREGKHNYHNYSIEDSLIQQEEYKKEMSYIANSTKQIGIYELKNKSLDATVRTIVDLILTNELKVNSK